jgi:DNA invertase Pin-like site-specific DNA recombinase
MTTKPIRFAPLIRVSTEQQEKKGESLRTQREQIQHYVKALGGEIPERCWEYSGQEHATPGQERQKLDKLLEDSGKHVFDAVIVCDASRWSRDNEKSKAGLRILRQHGIRFFVAGMEYNLHSPEQSLFLGLAAEINEFHAKNQNLKSIQNRIARAKRGLPTTGKLPYGRTFDSVTERWGIDGEKARNIQWAADQYLNHSKSIVDLAKTLGMNVSNLWKVLTKRSGDTWTIEFNSTSLNIDEAVTLKIPRLLPEETIQAIHERAKTNKTYTHGEIKYNYLLSRMVFCADCGNAMFGQTNHQTTRYYRHPRGRLTPCNPGLWVRADELEEAVLLHLFSLFGNIAAMERAIERAIPDHSRLTALQEQKTVFETKLAAVQKEKQNLIRSVAKGILTDEDVAKDILEIREREALLTAEIDRITPQLENVPTRKHIEKSARMVAKIFKVAYSEKGALTKMSYKDQRELIQRAFAGKDNEGRRLGVFVRKSDKPDKPWEFSIKGILATLEGQLPLTEQDKEELIGGYEEETKYAYRCRAAALRGCRSPPGRRRQWG